MSALFKALPKESGIGQIRQLTKGDNQRNAFNLFENQSDEERRRRLRQSTGRPIDLGSGAIPLGGTGPFGRRLR